MIIKKRKKKRKSNIKQSKKLNDKPAISLISLPLTDRVLHDSKEKNVSPAVSYREESKRILKLIVYINEFDRLDEEGKQICRNNNCENFVCKPFRKYCSRKCSAEFTRWYNKNFYWRNIRNSILKRDNYTCQICGLKLNKKKRHNKKIENWLECDHIIPKSYYTFLGYSFDTLENKVKTVLEFLHNDKNLRTLCYKCHKGVTLNNFKAKALLININDDN
ncbi:MAG: HNH endonuclease signature motif containing protein [Candidatus Nitrosocosmicus sp.]|nr:HNH endonuclease signature motif containing protein [Candidatus Nitrosocosmicus sp.]